MRGLEDRIVWEDRHLIVVNKACGELAQGDRTEDPSLLTSIADLIKVRDKKPGNVFLGVVHRLDRPTSGVIVYAKTSKALSRMNEAFRDRTVRKYYLLLCSRPEGGKALPPQGSLRDLLLRDPKTNTSRVAEPAAAGSKLGLEAELSYRLVEELDSYLAYEVELKTGRHHQIRVQFASRGMPLRGDRKYGAKRGGPEGSIGLHAWRIEFPHPVRDEIITCTADPMESSPDPIWESVRSARVSR